VKPRQAWRESSLTFKRPSLTGRQHRLYDDDAPEGLPPRIAGAALSCEDFLNFLVDDPVTFQVAETPVAYADLRDLGKQRFEAHPEKDSNQDLRTALFELRPSVYAFATATMRGKTFFSRRTDSGPGELLNAVEQLIESEAVMREICERTTKVLGVPDDQHEYLLAVGRSDFDAAIRALTSLTAEQITLQNHLRYFVTVGMPMEYELDLLEAEKLYNPMFELRDRYFATPERGLLSEYLATVKSIASSRQYEKLTQRASSSGNKMIYKMVDQDDFEAVLESTTNELEVMALLEHIS
jgi:hypothetical protein